MPLRKDGVAGEAQGADLMKRNDVMRARRGVLSGAVRLMFAGAMLMGAAATAGAVTLSRQALRGLVLPSKPPCRPTIP